ncbi:MAG: hypothetical protein MJY65_05440 [Bacteroidaceae bacterium]|nr:hypothetical protein [Bacteroidaceae bacterium]
MRIVRRLLMIAFCALSCLYVGAQETGMQSPGQALMRFAGNVHQFGHIFPQEKVYLQFDNTSYYTGETIWFKAFVVQASDCHRAPSGVLYVELLSPNGTVLKQEKLKIVAGQADGSFPLVDGATQAARDRRGTVLPYSSGFYEVRAYTSHMLNFGDDKVFSRVLPVFENPVIEGNYYGEHPVIKEKKSDIEQYRPQVREMDALNAEFYPEGGHLITGLPCRVAFKLTGSNGLGVDADGFLNDEVPLEVVHDGMGSFVVTPTGKTGKVSFTYDGSTYSFKLPSAEPDGYAMAVANAGDSLSVSVIASAKMYEDTLGLTLTCRGEVMHFGKLAVKPGMSAMAGIPLDGVPEGVCQLTLFDVSGNVYATRYIYHRGSQPVPKLTFVTDRDKYEPFEKIHIDFNLTAGVDSVPLRDRFCLSVRDGKCPEMVSETDLRTSLLLSSDLRGMVYEPEYYFESDDREHSEALDLLMLVQGWERYDWRMMAAVTPYQEQHRLERGLGMNGWIQSVGRRKPMDGIITRASVMPLLDKSKTEMFKCKTEQGGYFGFNISDFDELAHVRLSVDDKRFLKLGSPARIMLERSIIPEIRQYSPEELVIAGSKRNVVGKRRRYRDVVTEIVGEDSLIAPKLVYEDMGYLLPDVDINDKRIYIDYFTFKTHDVKSDTEHERDKGEFTTDLQGYLIEKGYAKEQYPNIRWIYYVHDSKEYLYQGKYEHPMEIDAVDIKSINVFEKPMYMKDLLELCPLYKKHLTNTMVYLSVDELYERVRLVEVVMKEDFERATRKELFDISSRLTTLLGYSRHYDFYSPQYPDGPLKGDVDYRRTLYWNPNVITDENGHAEVEFYNNSYSESFTIAGAGITASGVPYEIRDAF